MPAPAPAHTATRRATVSTAVACKLPSGLILTHGRTVMEDGKPAIDANTGIVRMENAQTVRLFGAHYNGDEDEDTAFGGIAGGYGITLGVDAEWIGHWMAQHKDFAPVANGSILIGEDAAKLASEAKAKKSLRSGFEAISPSELDKFASDQAKLETAER